MRSIAIELKLECRSCGNNIPLNGLAREYACKNCLEVTRLSPKRLGELVNEVILRVVKNNDNRLNLTGNIIPFYVEGMHCLRLYGPQVPTFKNQKVNLENIATDAANGFMMVETERVMVRTVPEPFAEIITEVAYLVGEDEEVMGNGAEKNEAASPILFSCLSCGGGLSIDGSVRVVNCSYCGSQSFLPDALWFKFHPVTKVKRWYMLLK